MVAKIATVGLVILVVGLLLGVYAAFVPVSAQKQSSYSLLNTSLRIDPNDYQSENTQLAAGQTVTIQTVSISNQSISVYFYIMNQSQYYNFYGCAPFCEGAPNGSAAFANGAGLTSVALTSFTNQTVSSSSPLSNFNFTAPSNGTYYFIFDNSRGGNYATYVNQNATGFTTGSFSLLAYTTTSSKSVNSVFLYAGVALLIVGGAVATAMWDSGKKPRAPPPRTTTTTTPSTPPTTTA